MSAPASALASPLASAAPVALGVHRVAKNFGGLVVLREVSFEVAQGEIVGLMGPNGAGKSTLFEIIGGGLKPAAGHVSFFGENLGKLPPHRRRRAGLCRTFQKIRLFDSLSVAENVMVAASETCGTVREAANAVDQTIALLALERIAKRRPTELTLADRKRLEIARAVVGHCRVLLLDESLSGLTHDEAQELISVIRDLNQRLGLTIVLVEHVMPIVMALAQRLVVLHYGTVIASGSPAQIVRDPVVIEAYLGRERPLDQTTEPPR